MFKRTDNKNADSGLPMGMVSSIAQGMTINGDVETDGDIRIDGKVDGHIFCKGKVVLGASGSVEGDLNAGTADIFGIVNGNVQTKDLLSLKTKCTINGNLFVGRLNIEPDANFNGQCKMSDGSPAQAVNEAKAILAGKN